MNWSPFLLQILLIALNAVFAGAEIAVLSINETKLKKMAGEGDKRAKRLSVLTEQPARFLATIQVAITLAGMLSSAFAAENFAVPLVSALVAAGLPIPENILKSICVLVITVILAFFNLVFGELVPKRIAMNKSEPIALGLSGVLRSVSVVFAPLVWLLTTSTNLVLHLLGIDPNDNGDKVSEEEIRMMLEAGSESGTIDGEEITMIQNIFAFDDTAIECVCTHRIDVETLESDESMEVWHNIIQETRYSCYPVTGEDGDDVIGVLNTKDYFRLADKSRENVMQHAVDKPYFVPDHMKADVLFRNMRKDRKYFAVLLDEYGGFSGIITLRDIFQLLVGDFYNDDEEQEQEEIQKIGDRQWHIQGSALLEDIEKALDISLPTEEYETFSGYVCGSIGRIPDDGSSFTWDTDVLHIIVHNVIDHKIGNATVMLPTEDTSMQKTEESK